MNDSHLFKLARECSLKSDYTGCGSARVGAVVTLKGTVIAKGWNSNKTHTDQAIWNTKRFKNSGNHYLPDKLHAEIFALSKIKYLDVDFSKVHIYVYRELRNGRIALAKPCSSCLAAIKKLGIVNIHYSTSDGFASEFLKNN